MSLFDKEAYEIVRWSEIYDADRVLDREIIKSAKRWSISRQIKHRITTTHEFKLEMDKYYIY